MKKRLKFLKQFMRKNLLRYFSAIIFSGISVLFSVLSPMTVSFAIDSVIGSEPMNLPGWLMRMVENYGGREALRGNLWILGLIFLLLQLLAGVFQYLRGR